ncbi:MAG: hypothetical protein CMK09_06940 [Ponticaulis sp.]|nr:hypothetical protein [Ponticaulis sp.]|tara:strand:- start:72414 stop:72845 length:432 start_codon:yes stop_codon:yes gene_type:complete
MRVLVSGLIGIAALANLSVQADPVSDAFQPNCEIVMGDEYHRDWLESLDVTVSEVCSCMENMAGEKADEEQMQLDLALQETADEMTANSVDAMQASSQLSASVVGQAAGDPNAMQLLKGLSASRQLMFDMRDSYNTAGVCPVS